MSRRAIHLAAAVMGLAAASLACTVLWAQQALENRNVPRYRRVFVPEEQLKAHVKGLLPVKREEFVRRLASRGTAAPGAVNGPRISRGRYAARLEGHDLVNGVARFEIDCPTGGAGSLSWEGSNLAFEPGNWEEEPPRKALLRNGPDDALSLRVNKSGVVSFPWSRRGQPIEKGGITFELELPPAALHELRLVLPGSLRLTAEQGLVTRGEPGGETGEVEWLVELGGMRRVKLQVHADTAAQGGAPFTLLRELTRYSLTPTDVTAEFQFQLELHGQSLRTAQLVVDPQLQVTGVSVRTLPVPWSIATGEKSHILSVEFPESLAGGNHTVVVQTTSKLLVTEPWRLPRIAWQGAVWQEGSATLSIPPLLQVAVTETHSCRATIGVPLAAGGESLGFQYHAADAYAEIEASPRRARLVSAMGVTAEFDSTTQITATMQVEITSEEGETFEIDAVVAKEWTVDSLETQPPDLLEDRPVLFEDEQMRTMRLKFVRPIAPRFPMRLVIQARRQQADVSELSSDTLWRWFQLPGAQPRPSVLSLRNNLSTYDLRIVGDIDAERLDAETAPADELTLLEAPAAGLLFRLPPESSAFQVLLEEGKPRYTAAWEISAACGRSRIRQEMLLRCVPSGPGVSRISLRSTPPPDREFRWRLAGISDATIVSQTRRDVGVSAESPAAEAIWDLEFSRPLGQSFALEASWETPRQASHPIALFYCTEASGQTCLVRLTAEGDARWLTSASGLTALPIVAEDDGRFTSTRGLFRYETGRRPLRLAVLDAGEAELAPLARIERAEMSSRFAADGSALCALSLGIVNTGMARLPVDLPRGAVLQEVFVNGRTTDPVRAGTGPGDLRIPLPAGESRLDVRIAYATAPQQRPLYVQTWRGELPALSLPTPPLVWRVALPPGIRRVESRQEAAWQEQLRSRFWGPFVDSLPGARWLHPWNRARLEGERNAQRGEREGDGQSGTAHTGTDAGWTQMTEVRPWSSALTLEVCEQHRLALFSLVVALLCTGLVLVASRRWLSGWFLVAAIMAALTMLVPMAWTPPLAGMFWGLLAGCATALLRPAPAALRSSAAPPASTARWLAGASASLFLLFAWFSAGAPATLNAQPPSSARASERNPPALQRVVIPVDGNQKPVGDYVFVEDQFYDWLFAQPQSGLVGGAWQITSASYDVRWPEIETAGTPAAEIRANFDLETFAADVPLALPFRRQELLLRQGGSRLDGVPLAVSWREDGLALLATIPDAGKYRLELSFSAPLQGTDRKELSVSIPRVPHATAHLSNLVGTAPPTSNSALGALRSLNDVADDWRLELGAVSELSVRAAAFSSPSDQQPIEAEQLLWWKVRPGSVVVDAVCKFRALMGPLREVQLRFDPRLRLLPLTDLPPGASYRIEEGTASTLKVSLSETSQELVLRPRFLLSQSSGIGKIIPPRIEPVAARISRQWMAVTATPGLELMPLEQPLANVVPTDFAKASGVVDALPQVAFALEGTAATPEMVFRPESRRPFSTSQTTVFCGLRSCRLQFETEFTNLAAHHVQQRVAIPPGWIATHAAVRDGDLPVASRWFQQGDGHVVVRLNQPPGTSQQLEIHAVATPSVGTPLSFSPPQPLDVEDGGHALRVLRGYDCDVQVLADGSGWTDATESQTGRVVDGAYRLVASLDASSEKERRPLQIVVTPNRPEVSARLVTRYEPGAGASNKVTLLCDLDVRGGKLDVVRLEVPADWSGPWETTPPVSVQTVSIPGEERHIVELVPDLALSGKFQLTLQAPLRQSAGEAIGVPDVTLIDVRQLQRLVQVPKAAEGEAATWRVAGLQAASLPPDLRSGPLSEGSYETLAVVAPQFDAVLSPGRAAKRQPLVWLAQYHAKWQPSGILHGEATFLLDPTGMSSCLLQFPPDCRPTFALQDGVPADLIQDRPGVWRLRFVGERLPQRLTLGFLGATRITKEQVTAEGPTIIDLPAKSTIWSLAGPPALESRESDLRAQDEVVQLRQDMLLLNAIAELLEHAVRRDLTGLSSEALSHWVRPWRLEATAASQRVRAALNAVVGEEKEWRPAFRELEAKLDQLWTTLPADLSAEVSATAADDSDDEETRHFAAAFERHQPRIQFVYVERAENERGKRAAIAGLFLFGVTLLWLIVRWTPVRDWLTVSAPFLVVATGVALACLSPLGVLALVLTALGLAAAWHSPWSRPTSEDRSSILRSSVRSGAVP